MPTLKNLLMLRECKGGKPALEVYKDSLGVLTVGIGHKVLPTDKLKLNDKIDDTRVDAFFAKDTKKAVAAAKSQAAKAGIKDAQFIVYLASVNFQLGTALVYHPQEDLAPDPAMATTRAPPSKSRKSKWASQTPVRVKDFKKALLALPQARRPRPKGGKSRRIARLTFRPQPPTSAA